jgi:hypothetical protein
VVKPVLITSLSDKDISESVKKRAGEDNVSVFSQEAISNILDKIKSGSSVRDILSIFGISHVIWG